MAEEKLNHTPGPWNAKAVIAASRRPSPEAFACPDFWGVVAKDQRSGYGLVITKVEACEWRPFPEADAKLIAKAPAMFKALEAALPILADHVALTGGEMKEVGGSAIDRMVHDMIEQLIREIKS